MMRVIRVNDELVYGIRALNRKVIMLVMRREPHERDVGIMDLGCHPSLPVSDVVERTGIASKLAADVL